MGYWETRNEELYKAGEMQVNEYFKKLEKAFNQTKRELQKTVESFCWRYAEENGLTYAESQKRLDEAEIKGLRDFIEKSMQNIGKYNQEVNNMSIKARMTRYQALETQIDAMLRELYAVDYQAEAEKTMQEIYADTYNRTWYNIDQYRGFHSAFAQVDPYAVEKLLEYPFNGANFSGRLWKQKDHLQTVLMESITTIMVQGVPPQNLAKDFAKKMQSKKFDAYRLLHTESSFLISEATHAGYEADSVNKYEILATLDSKTCGICGVLDGKVYEVKEAVTGKNMPPFHPLCRCTDIPHYDDEDLSDQTRVARDPETGKTYEVPADMSYPEWKKVVDGDGDFTKRKTVAKKSDSGIIKAIKLPKEAYAARNITPDIIDDIQSGIDEIMAEYDVKIDRFLVEDVSDRLPDVPYLIRFVDNSGMKEVDFVINEGYDFSDLRRIVKDGYEYGYFAGKDIKDHAIHEMAHAMTGQQYKTISAFDDFTERIEKMYVPGVSGYADDARDGFEVIAEAFVRMRNGEKVPLGAEKLVQKYIERWRKQ